MIVRRVRSSFSDYIGPTAEQAAASGETVERLAADRERLQSELDEQLVIVERRRLTATRTATAQGRAEIKLREIQAGLSAIDRALAALGMEVVEDGKDAEAGA